MMRAVTVNEFVRQSAVTAIGSIDPLELSEGDTVPVAPKRSGSSTAPVAARYSR
jgi:hypothetical protein